MDRSAQIIVAGFHRSGTSMAMQALKKAGLYIGDSLLGAAPSNPDGHFEDIETMKLHDRWLKAAGTDWCCTAQPPAPSENEATLGIQPIVKRLGENHPQWGLKDPRVCLYLNEWFSQLTNPYCVMVYRHYASCASSLRRRQGGMLFTQPSSNADRIRFWADSSLALQSWIIHNQAIIKHFKENPSRCILLSQESQIAGANLPSLVQAKLPVNVNVDIDTGVDETKTTLEKTIQLDAIALQQALDDTWNELQALSAVKATHYPTVEWCKASEDPSDQALEETLKQLHASWDELGVPVSSGAPTQ